MSSILKIMDQIEPGHPELFALEFGQIAESDFFYTLSSANIDQTDEVDHRSNRTRTV